MAWQELNSIIARRSLPRLDERPDRLQIDEHGWSRSTRCMVHEYGPM